jgi:hypothetical protein
MITIFDKNNVAYFIRPCPLINLTWNSNYNAEGSLGGQYELTLTGTILSNGGSPIWHFEDRMDQQADTTFSSQYYPNGSGSKPPFNNDPELTGLNAILAKQIALRELFSKKCFKMEVGSVVFGETEPLFQCYPKFISINFAEDIWTNKCNYTITLEAQFLLDKEDKIIGAESYATDKFKPGDPGWQAGDAPTIEDFLDKNGGFVEDYQETWSLEPEDGNGNTVDPYSGSENITKIYRLTRNVSAKGKDISGFECFANRPKETLKSHAQAKGYVLNRIKPSGTGGPINGYDSYPSTGGIDTYFASGILNIGSAHGGFNHSRTENIDVTQGTYGVQDTWILSSGNSYENYSLSLNSSESDPLTRVSIQGTIKGLTSIPASGSVFGGNHTSSLNTAYENAINKYRAITNNGQFGLNAHTYKRAQNAAGGITLNEIPLSISLGTNEFTGEINYTIEYDSRSRNFVSGVSFEGISVTDSYPGDIFAIIPVIGRPTGPVLQYIGGRTEYKRQLSINLVVDGITISASGNQSVNRDSLLSKPSLREPTRAGIISAINAYSPAREPGIRKYFVDPPTETWDPKDGRYSLNITWTYELNY